MFQGYDSISDQSGWHDPITRSSLSINIIQEESLLIWECGLRHRNRWNLLSAPEDLCCYHQTRASEKTKQNASLRTSVTHELLQKWTEIIYHVLERLHVIWDRVFLPFLSSSHMPTSHSECDHAGLGQHQGTLWVCNLTELGKCRPTATRH